MNMLKTLSIAATASALALAALGCAKKKPAAPAADASLPLNESVTDVTTASSPAFTPAQPQFEPAIPAVTTTPAPAPAEVASGGSSYTVKRGDTLFGIARTQYGDGKQWQRITAANPGLSPATLKAGQTITLP